MPLTPTESDQYGTDLIKFKHFLFQNAPDIKRSQTIYSQGFAQDTNEGAFNTSLEPLVSSGKRSSQIPPSQWLLYPNLRSLVVEDMSPLF